MPDKAVASEYWYRMLINWSIDVDPDNHVVAEPSEEKAKPAQSGGARGGEADLHNHSFLLSIHVTVPGLAMTFGWLRVDT